MSEWQVSWFGLRMMGLLVAPPHGRRGRATLLSAGIRIGNNIGWHKHESLRPVLRKITKGVHPNVSDPIIYENAVHFRACRNTPHRIFAFRHWPSVRFLDHSSADYVRAVQPLFRLYWPRTEHPLEWQREIHPGFTNVVSRSNARPGRRR